MNLIFSELNFYAIRSDHSTENIEPKASSIIFQKFVIFFLTVDQYLHLFHNYIWFAVGVAVGAGVAPGTGVDATAGVAALVAALPVVSAVAVSPV